MNYSLSCTRHRGFSLVELLVVMGIVAVLLGLLIATISSAIGQSQAISCESTVRQICMAQSQYAADNQQHYPPNLSSPASGQFRSADFLPPT
jgi:prepilin-type N-terminal cleavage/methylation domain-containing protein